MGTRTAITAVLAACALLAGIATSATAAEPVTISAGFIDGPRQDVDATVWVRGTSDVARYVSAWVPHRGLGCSADFRTNVIADVPIEAGEFALSGTVNLQDIGKRRLCARVHDAIYGNDPVAVLDQPFEVGIARATVTIDARRDGRTYAITVSGTAEARRNLWVGWTTGASCGSSSDEIGSSRVGPGPFSVAYSRTAYGRDATQQVICVSVYSVYAIDEQGRSYRDATGQLVLDFPAVPRDQPPGPVVIGTPPRPVPQLPSTVSATAPADGASGVILNPTFTWATSSNRKRFPPAADTLEIRRVRDGRVRPLLRLNGSEFRLLDEDAGMEMYADGDTETIARHQVGGGIAWVRLERGLPPGTYEWSVERKGHTASAARRFTVVAPRIERLTVRPRRKDNRSSYDPGWTFLTLDSAPYVRYDVAYRLGDGRWTRYAIPARRTSRQSAVIGWSCKRPGGSFAWRLTATDGWGARRTASGSTRNVTRGHCDRLRRREAAERRAAERRRIAEERRRRAEAERRRRAEERRRAAEQERFKRNCEAVGGTPVWIDQGGGYSRLICRAPLGGELPVPGFDY